MNKKALFTSNSNEWYTPKSLFNQIQKELNINFDLDPCATEISAKCDKYYTKEDDGLNKSWQGHKVFINPPYSRNLQPAFIRKAYEESRKDNTICVLLIPARTDTKIFHDIIFPNASSIYFIKGRIKFETLEEGELVLKDASTFPSAIIVFDKNNKNRNINTMEQK